jgi:hypothetical protein
MPNSSSTGGYLVPMTGTTPPYDATLEDIFQGAIVGITGLAGNMVRPRFQPEPPNQPDFNTTWISFSVAPVAQDTFTYEPHKPLVDTDGSDEVQRDEFLELYLSAYGSNCAAIMGQFSAGISLQQNRLVLQSYGIKLIDPGKFVYLPALLKEKYVKRIDLKSRWARRNTIVYPIRTVADATVIVKTDDPFTTTITVSP